MKDEEFGKLTNLIVPSLIGAAISLGILLLLTFLTAGALYMTEDPGKLVDAASVTILIAASFLSGVVGTKKADGVIGGIVSGGILTLIIMILSLFFKESDPASAISAMPYSLIIRLAGLAAVIAGAFLTSYFNNKNKNQKLGVKIPKIKKFR